MPFWKKKQEPEVPQVEPGLQSQAGGIKFSNEPAFGKPIPLSEVDLPPAEKQQAPGVVSFSKSDPVNTPVQTEQAEVPVHENSVSEPKQEAFGISKPKATKADINEEEAKKRRWIKARRRFIGALMLLLVAAIILPLLFDKEPPPKTVTIPLRIPSENSVDVAKITVPGTAEQASAQSQTKEESKKQTPTLSAEPTKADSTADVKPAAKTDSKVETPKVAKKGDKTTSKAETKKDDKTAAKLEDKKDAAKTKTETKKNEPQKKADEANKVPAMAKGSFFVQVIALSNEARAKEIANKLKKAGVNAFLSPISTKSGKVYRVQCGPFKSKEQANAANAKISMSGISAGKVFQVK